MSVRASRSLQPASRARAEESANRQGRVKPQNRSDRHARAKSQPLRGAALYLNSRQRGAPHGMQDAGGLGQDASRIRCGCPTRGRQLRLTDAGAPAARLESPGCRMLESRACASRKPARRLYWLGRLRNTSRGSRRPPRIAYDVDAGARASKVSCSACLTSVFEMLTKSKSSVDYDLRI
jgi:hypothetical protein